MIAIISISKQGNQLALKLSERLSDEVCCYALPKWNKEGFLPIEGRLQDFCEHLFVKYDALIFIMASGIVVRSIAPWIKDKTSDPAVIVIDDKGKHVISLLSGHLGGANELTLKVAALISSTPVITTSSDVNQLPSVDLMAQKYGLHIDSMKDATTISAMIVNRERVQLVDEDNIFQSLNMPFVEGEVSGKIMVSNKLAIAELLPFVKLIPANIILGVGCKKNTDSKKLWDFINENFNTLHLDLRSVKTIASIDVKENEIAILDAAKQLQCTTQFFSSDELQKVDHLFEGSEFVRSTVGVASVSSTAAYLVGNMNGEFLIKKAKHDGMTLSVFEMKNKSYVSHLPKGQ